ncbi:MAG: hypothetical protein IPP88_13370 [Betaproteobacteria bacterium]|nr:hypothetical protein [Betaproteobacteria bacterium]
MRDTKSGRFPLGRIVATPAALAALAGAGRDAQSFLERHVEGDWDEMSAEDQASNLWAIEAGERVFSSYQLTRETKLWVITEADRSSTCVLLPGDY